MSKYTFSKAEILEQLEKQLKFIRRSCDSFDIGHQDEASRLAVFIRILVHDTPALTSLLQHLKIKGKIEYWDSAFEYNPNNFLTHLGLVCMQSKVGSNGLISTYEPAFDGPDPDTGAWQSFTWWWNKQPIIVDLKKQQGLAAVAKLFRQGMTLI